MTKTKFKKTELENGDIYIERFICEKWREIYYEFSDGFKVWKGYSKKGAVIHYKDSDGEESWLDEEDNKITKEEFNKTWKLEKDGLYSLKKKPEPKPKIKYPIVTYLTEKQIKKEVK